MRSSPFNLKDLRILPRWIIILIDLGIIYFSITLAYLLRFNFDLTELAERSFFLESGVFISFSLGAILVTRSYSGIIRYTGIQDAVRIVYTMLIAAVAVIIINAFWENLIGERIIPLSVIIISYFASVFFLISYRLIVKNLFSYYSAAVKKQHNVLIYGAGHLGRITKQVIDHDSSSRFKVVGFIEDDFRKSGKVTDGVRIYPAERLERVVNRLDVRELVIAIRDLDRRKKNRIVDECLKFGLKVNHVPEAEKWLKGELSVSQIKEVRIEDLLGRETIKLNNLQVGAELNARCVMVTGAAGSIGMEIVNQVLTYNPSYIILLDHSETGMFDLERKLAVNFNDKKHISVVADVRNRDRMELVFKKYRPEVIYHAAAYKHVPVMERNPVEAVLTNICGTKVMADLAFEYGIRKFVMVSTDKAVNPTNVMGASKRIAEMYVQALNNFKISDKEHYTKFVTTRFGNVLGSAGSVIPVFKEQIASGGPVTVTHPEITRYFMTIPEACELVLEAGAMGNGGEIYIFDMGESIRIVDLAKKMIRLSGLEINKDIEIQFTGLRDGEKLYEELLNTTEDNLPTHHEKIMIAKVKEYSFMQIAKEIDKLIEIIYKNDELALVGKMKEIVPEFKSNASRFEKLDKVIAK